MGYSARILADSMNPKGVRLTTFEITYPRFIHAEFMTHRMFSRNAASSRAIPIEKMIQRVEDDPALPVWWGKNQPGMQANEELPSDSAYLSRHTSIPQMTKEWAEHEWLLARDAAVESAKTLYNNGRGLHKQIVNRLLEPWMWITVIVSATEWNNFWKLRCHKDAQPEIQKIARMMYEAYEQNEVDRLQEGDWHLPLVGFPGDKELKKQSKPIDDGRGGLLYFRHDILASIGRCARVSYLTHEGKRDPEADVSLAVDRLLHPDKPDDPMHLSPWEHAAMALNDTDFVGNFRGFKQARKFFPHESGEA